jgi:plasmid stability protein
MHSYRRKAMATVTIRNLDDEVVRKLKAQAKEHNRSLEAELREVLAQLAARRRSRTELLAEADRIAAMTPKDVVQTDSTLLIREDRDR